MEKHFELSDDQFEQQFSDCTLDPANFSHEAHLRLAWIHIKKYGVEAAVENICNQLVKFTAFVGAADKYNKTLTIAAVRMVNHFINRSHADSFYEFIHEYPGQKTRFRELIATHYHVDIFKSVTAKKEYLEPDLLPFT